MTWPEYLMRPDLRRLAGYSSARTKAKFEASSALDANESPWPPFGPVTSPSKSHRYPDPQMQLLRQRLAAIHVTVTGENTHQMVEAVFKATGRALRQAFRREGGGAIPSTKGVL